MTIPLHLITDILKENPNLDKQTILSHLKLRGITEETDLLIWKQAENNR
jgi:hypothetical protein